MLKHFRSISLVLLVASLTLTGCTSHKEKSVSSTKPKQTKIQLLGNFKSDSKGIYMLRGKTNSKAKVWYHYKSGSKVSKDTFHANKAGNFKILVKNNSSSQKATSIEVNVKANGMKTNFDVASIENKSSAFLSQRSEKYKLTSNEKAALTASELRESSKKASENESLKAVEESEDREYNSTKSSYKSRYKKVSLVKFTQNTSAYDGKDIQTSGTVVYIQKNPDDNTMYYAVIVPKDEYDSSGYSTGHGTVTEIDVDTMKDKNIHEGDTITVRGGGLQDTVKLNGKRLNSDIIVDSVSK